MKLFEILRRRLGTSANALPENVPSEHDDNRYLSRPQRAMRALLDVRPARIDATQVGHSIEQALTRAGLMKPSIAPLGSGAAAPLSTSTRRRPASTDASSAATQGGTFVSRTFSNAAGMRAYKLFVPEGCSTRVDAPALVVMLHGCTQSADDFAAGTGMNRLAARAGFLVVYPEQAARANGSRCWNWFMPRDQIRDGGEPSLLSGITREVAAEHRVDSRRIFVAGLSAGAAMAVVLGETYPELYAAVGAHSGLPFGAAHDVASAFAAMKNPVAAPVRKNTHEAVAEHEYPRTIIFHGDNDATVGVANASAIEAHALEKVSALHPCRTTSEQGRTPTGMSYQRTMHVDADRCSRVERWTLHGAGHAWSGGSAEGSYTDPDGVDASAEMARFFGI